MLLISRAGEWGSCGAVFEIFRWGLSSLDRPQMYYLHIHRQVHSSSCLSSPSLKWLELASVQISPQHSAHSLLCLQHCSWFLSSSFVSPQWVPILDPS